MFVSVQNEERGGEAPTLGKLALPDRVPASFGDGQLQRRPADKSAPATVAAPPASPPPAPAPPVSATLPDEEAPIPLVPVSEQEEAALAPAQQASVEPILLTEPDSAIAADPILLTEPDPVALEASPVQASPIEIVAAAPAGRQVQTRQPRENEYSQASEQQLRDVVLEAGAKGIEQIRAGVILLRDGYLNLAELQEYFKKMETAGRMRLEEMLQQDGILSEHDATVLYAQRLNMPFIDLDQVEVDSLALRYISGDIAVKALALPYSRELDQNNETTRVWVALAEPENFVLKEQLTAIIADENGAGVDFAVAAPSLIRVTVGRYYHDIFSLDAAIESIPDDDVVDIIQEQIADNDEPTIKLVNQIIGAAVAEGASDIHCETTESRGMDVRIRVDGILKYLSPMPRQMRGLITNRLKILGNMDIGEQRRPQDGRARISLGNSNPIDLRMVTTPTIHGENISIRILDRSNLQLKVGELGFSESAVVAFESSLKKTHGSVLVTGPTGSGKTTTLYSALLILDKVRQNIVTIEDPVEYQITGINQCQVNDELDPPLSFTTALRGLMRADPDVIMVGEIRDPDTARISTEAALTGHLVLATLHTKDAASSITRLTEMGVANYSLASTLECVIAQRLCRKLCTSCRIEHTPTMEEMKVNSYPEEIIADADQHEFYVANPEGCQHCGKTGYRGRTAIAEVMIISDSIRQMITEKKGDDEIRDQAVEEGMTTLKREGFNKVAAGVTTIEEMLRVTS